jgi:transmembrane sensor
LAWQNGMLMFNNTPLHRVVAEFNRYNRRQLVIGDTAIADREIGGYFKSRNLDSFVRILQSSFGVNADVAGDQIILRAGQPTL